MSPSTAQIPVSADPSPATARGAGVVPSSSTFTGPAPAAPAPTSPAPAPPVLSGALRWLLPLGAVLSLAAVYFVFILTVRGQWVDERSLKGAVESAWGAYQRNQAVVSLDVLPLAVGLLGAAGVLISAAIRREVVVPLIAVAGGGAAMIATQMLKYELLTRPNLDVSAANMNSFPSGHSTAAAAAVLALVLAAPRVARPWLAIVGSVLAGAAGAGTLVMGWHRPSDIVGAFLVVVLCGMLAGAGVAWRERALASKRELRGLPPRRMDGRPGGFARACSLTVALLGLITVLVCAVLLAPQLRAPGTEDAPSVAWFFTVGMVLCMATACCVFPLLERWVDSFPRARRA